VIRDLQIVLKVAERCNINCSYCYYLNSDNELPFSRPPFISDEVASNVARFARESADQIPLGQLRIVLHGGEPLLLKKSKFRSICRILSQIEGYQSGVSIVITTNAMLIDDDWIDLLEEFRIGICVSLDGPQEYHDLERVDFKGLGTYSRVIEGVARLRKAAAAGRIAAPSVLAVIDPRAKGDVVYDHLFRQLGFRLGDFLVPMTLHDHKPRPEHIRAVGRFLIDAFNEWVRDDDARITIRIFHKYMSRLMGTAAPSSEDARQIVLGVGSDGTMINDDVMQILGPDIFDRHLNIGHSTMLDYLSELNRGEVAGVYESFSECVRCRWFQTCRPPTVPWAGAEMRYRRSTGFQNKLVHCESYQALFEEMQSYVEAATLSHAT
jgi:uncharacterized protein